MPLGGGKSALQERILNEFQYKRLCDVLKKMLSEEKVFLENITVVLMKIMSNEVISDAEGQMVRMQVPFFGEADGQSFA